MTTNNHENFIRCCWFCGRSGCSTCGKLRWRPPWMKWRLSSSKWQNVKYTPGIIWRTTISRLCPPNYGVVRVTQRKLKKIRLLKHVSKCNKLIFAIFFWPTGYIARRAHRWQHSVVFLKSNTELTIFTCTPSSPTDIHWPLSRALTPDNQRTRNTPDPPEGNMKFLLLLVCLALNILCITVQLKVPKQVENIQKKKIQGV